MEWTYKDFIGAVYKLTTIDLSSYKERQMKRRINSLLNRKNYNNYKDYYQALTSDNKTLEDFLNYLTINVSEFYRNSGQWDVLKKDIIPMLLDKHGSIKVWSAACSTGEEPYSMAMLLSEFMPLKDISIIATDIDKGALEKAEEGIYSEKSLESLPKVYQKKYFQKEDKLYRINDEIKRCVQFSQHNLLKDSFPKRCNLIICRNVMIYFTEEAKSKLYTKFRDSLVGDGILFVGSTEQIIFPQKYGLKSIRTFFYQKV